MRNPYNRYREVPRPQGSNNKLKKVAIIVIVTVVGMLYINSYNVAVDEYTDGMSSNGPVTKDSSSATSITSSSAVSLTGGSVGDTSTFHYGNQQQQSGQTDTSSYATSSTTSSSFDSQDDVSMNDNTTDDFIRSNDGDNDDTKNFEEFPMDDDDEVGKNTVDESEEEEEKTANIEVNEETDDQDEENNDAYEGEDDKSSMDMNEDDEEATDETEQGEGKGEGQVAVEEEEEKTVSTEVDEETHTQDEINDANEGDDDFSTDVDVDLDEDEHEATNDNKATDKTGEGEEKVLDSDTNEGVSEASMGEDDKEAVDETKEKEINTQVDEGNSATKSDEEISTDDDDSSTGDKEATGDEEERFDTPVDGEASTQDDVGDIIDETDEVPMNDDASSTEENKAIDDEDERVDTPVDGEASTQDDGSTDVNNNADNDDDKYYDDKADEFGDDDEALESLVLEKDASDEKGKDRSSDGESVSQDVVVNVGKGDKDDSKTLTEENTDNANKDLKNQIEEEHNDNDNRNQEIDENSKDKSSINKDDGTGEDEQSNKKQYEMRTCEFNPFAASINNSLTELINLVSIKDTEDVQSKEIMKKSNELLGIDTSTIARKTDEKSKTHHSNLGNIDHSICISSGSLSFLPGICGTEDHKPSAANNMIECNYMVALTNSINDKKMESFYSSFMNETRCNIFLTKLCGLSDIDAPVTSEMQSNERFRNIIETSCIESNTDENINQILSSKKVNDDDGEVVKRRVLVSEEAPGLPEIDLLYIDMWEIQSTGIVQSFMETNELKLKVINDSGDIKKDSITPMQIVFNNINGAKESNIVEKALSKGLTLVDFPEHKEKSNCLTFIRFKCILPKTSGMGGSAQFVGAGFPV